MFSVEPQRTQFDLNFQLFGIPVRIHPFFWLAGILLGASGSSFTSRDAMIGMLMWVGVLFFSILVHELGHAFTMRYYGASPRIVLYMMGGLAIAEQSPFGNEFYNRTRQPWNAIKIAFAGPAAGFVFAAIVIGLVYLAGGSVRSEMYKIVVPMFFVRDIANPYLTLLVTYLLYFNIYWGLVNLLPVYPLDGGQISRELFLLKDPWNGMVRSLWLSVFVGGLVSALAFLYLHDMFLGLLFGVLAFTSWQILQSFTGRGGGFGGPF